MFAGFVYAVILTENGSSVCVDRFRNPADARAKLVALEGERMAEVMDGDVIFSISKFAADLFA
jgi:hypothetical protein